MADLEIEPQASNLVSSTPSFPKSALVQEEIQRSAAQTDETIRRTAVLLSAIERQKESQRGAEAYIDLKEGLANLHEKTDPLTDLTLRKQTYDSGRSALIDNLKQKYPNLSPVQGKSLISAIEDDRRVFHAKLAAQGITNTKRDISKLFDSSSRLSAAAKSDKERQDIDTNFFNRLNSAAPILGSDVVKDYQVKYLHATSVQRVDNLINLDPKKVALMTPDEFTQAGLYPSEAYTAKTKALHTLNQLIGAGLQKRKEQKEEYITRFENGQTTPAEDLNAFRNQTLTRGDYHGKYGIEPPPEQNPSAVDYYRNEMDRISDPNEREKYYEDNVMTSNLNPVDKARLHVHFSNGQQDLKSQFKVAGINSLEQLNDHVNDRIGKVTPSLLKYLPGYSKLKPTLDAVKQRVNAAKNETEMQEYIQKGYEDTDKVIDQMLHKATKPSVPGVMKETEKPEEAAPAATVGPAGIVPEGQP